MTQTYTAAYQSFVSHALYAFIVATLLLFVFLVFLVSRSNRRPAPPTWHSSNHSKATPLGVAQPLRRRGGLNGH
jgi:hypothetical protein